jgi:hypothetical protein
MDSAVLRLIFSRRYSLVRLYNPGGHASTPIFRTHGTRRDRLKPVG